MLLPDWRLGGAKRAQQSEEMGGTGLLILTGTRDALSDESHMTNEETVAQSDAGLLAHEVPHPEQDTHRPLSNRPSQPGALEVCRRRPHAQRHLRTSPVPTRPCQEPEHSGRFLCAARFSK